MISVRFIYRKLVLTPCSIASGGISTFGSLIIKDFGYTNFEAILFNIPFGAIQIVSILGSSWGATRFKRKGLAIALVSILPAVGTIMMLTVPRKHKGVLLFGYYLVSCLAAITPLYYTWHVQNTAGDTKKKCTSAMVFVGMCTGNVIGPLLYSVDDAPQYRPGLLSNLIMFILVGVISLLIPIYLSFLNKSHAKRREQLGKSAARLDESMLEKNERDLSKAVELEKVDTQRQEQDNGFSDMTDMVNEDFIYGKSYGVSFSCQLTLCSLLRYARLVVRSCMSSLMHLSCQKMAVPSGELLPERRSREGNVQTNSERLKIVQ